MDAVIITGASGEPALSIARRLCGLGIRVYALAGTVPETGLSADEFVPVPCDLTSPDSVISAVEKILEKEPHVSGLVLAGQYLSDECFEAVSPEEIRLAFNAQTVSPLCAVRLVLPSVIAARGHVVVVSPGSGTAEARALNAASDGALRAFTAALFAELRDTGVKTCHILLQNNAGTPDPAARFTTAPQSRIHADIVADAVETVFRLRENNALTQMILRPQATRETPRLPVSAEPKIRALQAVQLPPAKNFPPEEEPIPTPPYRRPDYAPAKVDLPAGEREDEDGFADDYVDPELRHLVKNPPPQQQPRGNAENQGQQNGGRREGRNRRRKRNRRNRDGAMRITPPQFDAPQRQHQPQQPRRENENAPAPAPTESVPAGPASSRADAPTASAPAPATNVPAATEEKTSPQPPRPPTDNAPADSAPAPEKPMIPETAFPPKRAANVPASADREAVPADVAPASPQEEPAPAAEKKARRQKAPRKPRSPETKPRAPRKRKPRPETEPPAPAPTASEE